MKKISHLISNMTQKMSMTERKRGFTLIELIIILVIISIIGIFVYRYYQSHVNELSRITNESTENNVNNPSSTNRANDIIEVIIIGIIVSGGIIWQFYLINKRDSWDDGPPFRVIPAGIIGVIIFLGVVVFSILGYIDERRGLPFIFIFTNGGKALILCLVLILKSYFSPITAAFSLSCVVYFYFSYGEMHTIPLIQSIFEWVFISAPKWASAVYAVIVSLYSFSMAIVDSHFDIDVSHHS